MKVLLRLKFFLILFLICSVESLEASSRKAIIKTVDDDFQTIISTATSSQSIQPKKEKLPSSVDTLIPSFDELNIDPPITPTSQQKSLSWTHAPQNGQTLYIADNVSIAIPSQHYTNRRFPVVYSPLKDLFSNLNHSLYFGGYGGRANHLFVSLRIGFVKERTQEISWKTLILCWDETSKKFAYHSPEEMPESACYANFYNLTSSTWENEAPKKITGKKVKFVTYAHDHVTEVVSENETHSETAALGLVSKRKELILEELKKLGSLAKIKVMQLGLHSFLDFCEHCNLMVQRFQKIFPRQLFSYLQTNLTNDYPLKAKLSFKASPFLVMMTGMNNRFYRYNSYFCFDGNTGKENIQSFEGFFLKRYKPFIGEMKYDKKDQSDMHLLTYVREPIGQSGAEESLPHNLKVMIPLQSAALYWELSAHTLYNDLGDFLSLINPKLVMLDLSSARLGIEEYADDWDSYFLSEGNEALAVLEAIQPCDDLYHLNLSGNSLGQEKVITQLPRLLTPFKSLSFLSLAGALTQDTRGLKSVSKTLQLLPQLEHVDLSKNGFNEDMFTHLQEGLLALKKLKVLNLSRNHLSQCVDYKADYKGSVQEATTDALSWIIDYIHKTPSLQRVDIRKNDFDGISFQWEDFLDEVDIKMSELRQIKRKLIIEKDAGGDVLDSSSETTDSDEEEFVF